MHHEADKNIYNIDQQLYKSGVEKNMIFSKSKVVFLGFFLVLLFFLVFWFFSL